MKKQFVFEDNELCELVFFYLVNKNLVPNKDSDTHVKVKVRYERGNVKLVATVE